MNDWYEAVPIFKLGTIAFVALVTGVCFNHLVYWSNRSYEDYLNQQVQLKKISCEAQSDVN